MKNLYILMLTLFLTLSLAAEENWLSYNLNCNLLTEDSNQFSRELTHWAEETGGYYTLMSPQQVILRFPWESLPQFRQWINDNSREVYQMDQSSRDLREEIMNLRSGIDARKEVLERNLEYLDKSDFEGTLSLEKEVRRLMQEIDTRSGQLRRRENDRKMVMAVVNISFLNNSLPPKEYSSFEWINEVDFFQFIYHNSTERKFKNVPMDLPDGFALEMKGHLWQALSAEGIRLQMRWLDNYPSMDLPFWEQTVLQEFTARGYLPLADPYTLESKSGNSMTLMDWGVPYGQSDYRYLTGFMVSGNSILVLEAAGPVLLMDPYVENIENTLKESLP